ncbi:hypothetical protein MHO82_07450 [Vibrio sp. Of7-15]|uniref:hypothetical protein n=1 Tax=Vibrio sp. Of7-15 TaxID=2724879 RepID=UPI001EF2D700|nr:hypothetical protein [Vibrio sp. Of7-15]MCG7496694.1 hypothetical protein [Vibrio sp. Of7-15]
MHPTIYMFEKELVEHKIITRLPLFLAVCGFIFSISLFFNSSFSVQVSTTGYDNWSIPEQSYAFAGALGYLNSSLAGIVSLILFTMYIPKTLRKEQQEGSIMFWRSMPVTDLCTISVKLAVGLVVIPIICSFLLLASDLSFWIVDILSKNALSDFVGEISLGGAIVHWLEFITRMLLVSVTLFPLASLLFVTSQLTKYPLLNVFVIGGAISFFSENTLGLPIVGDFLSQQLSLPMAMLTENYPLSVLLGHGVVSLIISLCGGAGLFLLSVKLRSSTDKVIF